MAARSRLALAGEPDSGAVLDAGRQLDVERLAAAQGHALALERRGVLERHLEPVGDVGAALRRRAAPAEAAEPAAPAPRPGAAAEQPLEQGGNVGRPAAELEVHALGAAPEP